MFQHTRSLALLASAVSALLFASACTTEDTSSSLSRAIIQTSCAADTD
jgi:hypothetical protein